MSIPITLTIVVTSTVTFSTPIEKDPTRPLADTVLVTSAHLETLLDFAKFELEILDPLFGF